MIALGLAAANCAAPVPARADASRPQYRVDSGWRVRRQAGPGGAWIRHREPLQVTPEPGGRGRDVRNTHNRAVTTTDSPTYSWGSRQQTEPRVSGGRLIVMNAFCGRVKTCHVRQIVPKEPTPPAAVLARPEVPPAPEAQPPAAPPVQAAEAAHAPVPETTAPGLRLAIGLRLALLLPAAR